MARIKSNFLPVRNEGKIKEYDSCSDNEAWSHCPVKRAHYFREWIKKNTFKCILPTSLLAKVLIGLEAKSKPSIKENRRLCCNTKCKALLVFKQMGSALPDKKTETNVTKIELSRELSTPEDSGKLKALKILNSIKVSSHTRTPAKSPSGDKVRCKRCTEVKNPRSSDEIFLWNQIEGRFPDDERSDREGSRRGSTKSDTSVHLKNSLEPPQAIECNCAEDGLLTETPEVEKETDTLYCKYCNDPDPEVTRDNNTDALWNSIKKCIPEAENADDRCSCCPRTQENKDAHRGHLTTSCSERVDPKRDEGIKSEKCSKCINLLWQKQTKKRTRCKNRKSCNEGDKMSEKPKPVKSEINIVMKVCSNEFEKIAYLQVIHKEKKCLPTKRPSKSKCSKGKQENPLKVLLKVRQAFQELIEREVAELTKSNKGMDNIN